MATSLAPGAAGVAGSHKVPSVELAEGASPRSDHRKLCSELFMREAVRDAFPKRGAA